jgi:cytochrome P450
MTAHALRLCDALARGAAEARSSAAVELSAPVRAAALDAFAELVFGLPDFGALIPGRRSALAHATDQFARAVARTSHVPPALVSFLDSLPARWHPLRARRQIAAALNALNALAGDAYDDAADEASAAAEAKASAARAARVRRPPAAPALKAAEPEVEAEGAAAAPLIALLARARVPRAEACELALGLLIHAHETTAHTACWALHLLARNPTEQAATRAELQGAAAQLRAEELEALPLLRAVWLEALRLYPTVPCIERVAGPGARLGGAALPTGARVCYSLAAAARAEAAGGQDAHAFRPSRFVDPATGALRADAGAAWMPYGAGPRRCAGERLAERLGLVLLASVLLRFELSTPTPASDVPVESTLDGTLAPSETGLRVAMILLSESR